MKKQVWTSANEQVAVAQAITDTPVAGNTDYGYGAGYARLDSQRVELVMTVETDVVFGAESIISLQIEGYTLAETPVATTDKVIISKTFAAATYSADDFVELLRASVPVNFAPLGKVSISATVAPTSGAVDVSLSARI